MKKLFYIFVGILITVPNFAAHAMPRTATKHSTRAMVGPALVNVHKPSLKWDQANFDEQISADTPAPNTPINNRDAERNACLSNNIGADATFVWASRNGDTTNYATMIEDTEHPENNTCFARVDIRSNDIGLNLSDFRGVYFPINQTVTCGSWINHDDLEKRILDSKKTTRTLATIGAAVGGAGIGVGVMELGGNKLLAKTDALKGLQGQKSLSGDELFISQLKDMKNNNKKQYDNIVNQLKMLRDACKNSIDKNCKLIDYNTILDSLGEQ